MDEVIHPTRDKNSNTTILIIEDDQKNFEVRKCIAQALGLLNTVTLLYARDVSEALHSIDECRPDAIIYSENDTSEKAFLLENLGEKHPPLVCQTSDTEHFKQKQNMLQNIMYVPEYDTLEGMHQVLLLATSMGKRFNDSLSISEVLH
ncbi:MAG TPA: hypothetical protein PKA63_11375 [Oligoflexia bacterium]|nr:hypothetical protein [Oligoflexia bacterium]HMP49259.1 hypothetical protein [Oligoflexia bacterium]